MRNLFSSLFTLGLGLLLSGSALVRAEDIAVSVSGTQKIETTNSSGASVIKVLPVNLKSLCAEYSASSKDYAAVFETGGKTLKLVAISASSGLGTITIATGGGNLGVYDSAAPRGYLTVDKLTAGADAPGTDFEGLTGIQSLTVSLNTMGNAKGVSGTLTGVATGAQNPGFFNIKVSGTKLFVQKP